MSPEDGDALWFFGSLAVVKAEGMDYALVEQFCRGGMITPLHVQAEDDETFYVLDGDVSFYVNQQWQRASAGTVAYIPRGAEHGFRVESKTARMLDLTTPQHLAFFRAAGEPARDRTLPPPGPPDMAKVAPAAERYKITILGPLPE